MRDLTAFDFSGSLRNGWRRLTGGKAPEAEIDEGAVDSEAERAIRMFGAPVPDPFPAAYRYEPPPGPDTRTERERARAPYTVFLPGLLIGGALGYAATIDDPTTIKALPARFAAVMNGEPYYLNCAHVRLVGAAPLLRGQPGYSRRLDTDGNGVACEPFFGKDKAKAKPAKDAPAKDAPVGKTHNG